MDIVVQKQSTMTYWLRLTYHERINLIKISCKYRITQGVLSTRAFNKYSTRQLLQYDNIENFSKLSTRQLVTCQLRQLFNLTTWKHVNFANLKTLTSWQLANSATLTTWQLWQLVNLTTCKLATFAKLRTLTNCKLANFANLTNWQLNSL